MQQTWPWFGPNDPALVNDLVQAGMQGVVSALHHIQPGAVWAPKRLRSGKALSPVCAMVRRRVSNGTW
ncbi:mannonate dehydratase [Primorskyibacter flagellatus]|uniref:D-mannonate dehydratase (UxuA) n=1 Tax=Primorskyibacter flagellatus TaxID=1387277 RepID=A0A1W2ELA4_9RHOB|nr:D-mannonate dehydratase (UxuA) [Primorskyibacter flagellatus]